MWGGNISVNLTLFVLLYNTNFMNKLRFNEFLRKKFIDCTNVLQSTKSPSFLYLEERLFNLVRARERFSGLSTVYYQFIPAPLQEWDDLVWYGLVWFGSLSSCFTTRKCCMQSLASAEMAFHGISGYMNSAFLTQASITTTF